MFKIRRLLMFLAPALVLTAVLTAVLGGSLEFALAHGVLHAALGNVQPADEPIPFWG